ncbi:MAG: filamentous hemagglutinin N-terminal domain-containing protein [Mojavia pulchra JT2-VF2]|jgi:filamentous hemagglutinin family protein|uniref:Filamentous hemagglutinin N-terminal domain-containing protein n=1 Tax=Mojavia pulchra JT2-VF2 TaxID=287848 RepID=A0A951UK76_9NOST|nr:filamentous hemagglutinin N-terminal domain-containing protein [Mojavia pulchra JT2-VF2]
MKYTNLINAAIGSVFLFLSTNFVSEAQIIPDTTLPQSTSTKLEGNTRIIEGGTQAGSNLFHSFEKFSLTNGSTAYFNNPLDVENIINRVTGGSISNIDGILRANGKANFFLINPSGIIFGQNARLDIGGSFLASTASSLKFADSLEFSATNPHSTPLLSINLPMGLQYSSNTGIIRLQGTGHNLTGLAFSPVVRNNNLTGLRVQPGRTLALVGGNLILEGGTITAEGGRIELGSVGNNGLVNITPTTSGWNLEYKNVSSFQDISLLRRALADASGIGSGSIQIQGHKVTLTDGSVTLIQNQGLLPGGTLNVNTSESLEVSGTDPVAMIAGSLRNETLGFGKAGDILISTPKLILRNGGQISSLTFGAARTGNIVVNASDYVDLIGVSPLNSSVFSLISAATFSSGDVGNIAVSTGKLFITGGGALTSSTFGTGKGGNITVDAIDSVAVIGYAPMIFQASNISTTALNAGDAGNLTINTSNLSVRDGGLIDASTLASGNGGSITINALKNLEVSGTMSGSGELSLIVSSANIIAPTLQKLFRLPLKPSGKSGDVTINTNHLSVTNSAKVSVGNSGSGNAGKLKIDANTVNITNNGGITATTAIGQGGDIDIISGLFRLSNGIISSTAGQQGTNSDGGNITIDTDVLFSLGSSTITANTFGGRGGNVLINVDNGFFFSRNSRVEASSQFGINGTVQINGLPINSNSIKVATETIPVAPQVTSVCQGRADTGVSSFIVNTTRSPQSKPNDLMYNNVERNNFLPGQAVNNSHNPKPLTSNQPTQIIEANTLIRDAQGNLVLTTDQANAAFLDTSLSASSCFSAFQG